MWLWMCVVVGDGFNGVLVVPCGGCCGGGVGFWCCFVVMVFVVLMGRVGVMA